MHAYREALLYLKHMIVKMGMLLLIGFHPTVTKTLLLLFFKVMPFHNRLRFFDTVGNI